MGDLASATRQKEGLVVLALSAQTSLGAVPMKPCACQCKLQSWSQCQRLGSLNNAAPLLHVLDARGLPALCLAFDFRRINRLTVLPSPPLATDPILKWTIQAESGRNIIRSRDARVSCWGCGMILLRRSRTGHHCHYCPVSEVLRPW